MLFRSRESLEEAQVHVVVDRYLAVDVDDPLTYPIPTGTSVSSSTMCSPVVGSTGRHGWETTSRARCAGSTSTSFQRSVCDIERQSNWRWPRPGALSLGCCTDPLASVRIGTPDEIQDFAKPEVALT